jgi:hypothetical protein
VIRKKLKTNDKFELVSQNALADPSTTYTRVNRTDGRFILNDPTSTVYAFTELTNTTAKNASTELGIYVDSAPGFWEYNGN